MTKKFTQDEISNLMTQQTNIRNISVIAHVDHGKSTLTDSLVCAAGVMSIEQVGEKRFLDDREDEMQRGVTIKSSSISLAYQYDLNGAKTDILVNLIDTPGHLDFSSEVTSALRVTDGALVIVDCVEGVCVQTETVLRQSIQEQIVPVLMINKIDRAFKELQLSSEECYQNFYRIIENVNAVCSTYKGTTILDPSLGNVAFGSGKLGFGFTLTRFAKIYSKIFGVSVSTLMIKLWGDNYYDFESKKWSSSAVSKSGKTLKRAFCEFCLEPIQKLFKILGSDQVDFDKLDKILKVVDIQLTQNDKNKDSKDLLKHVVMKFLPAGEALLEMIAQHLPSPCKAQSYRYNHLYSGDLNDKFATSISKCDPEGPLIVFISKMVPSSGKGRFIAFGRVFSGTLKSGMQVRIMGNDYDKESKRDLTNGSIQRVLLMMGKNGKTIESCPAGNVVGILGIDKNIIKSCTLADEKEVDAMPFIKMNFSVSPVVKIAIKPLNPSDQPELIEGLKKLEKSDPLVQWEVDESRNIVVSGAGELHLEIILKDLQDEYCKGIKITTSTPAVTFMETVTTRSEMCLAKSPNKLNRVIATCEPLSDDIVKAIESGELDLKSSLKKLSNYGWDAEIIKKIWSFGPGEKGTNFLVDMTKGVDYLHEVKDHIVAAFQEVIVSGVLAGEKMRGCVFYVHDMVIHSDSSHRGARQFVPAAKRVFYAGQLTAGPRLVEPIFKVDISTSEECIGACYSVVNKKRGTVIGVEAREGTPMRVLSSYIPVMESFGLTELLRSQTSGKALAQSAFDHWLLCDSDPLEENSKMANKILEIRKRKGMKELEIPPLSRFLDKL